MKQRIWGSLGYVAALALVLWGTSAPPANAARCLEYGPSVVKLIGTISLQRGFGPPGFGEDPERDMKLSYAQLTLDRSICVDGGGDSDDVKETGVKYLHMLYDADNYPL